MQAMATITSAGLGSGLDISSLVSQLVSAERSPTETRLNTQEAKVQAKISAFGVLRSALAQFQTALGKLTDVDDFLAYKATSGNDKVFTASASSSAAAGTFDVVVERLAQSQKLVSGGFASSGTAVGTGTLTLSVGGDSFSVAVDAGNHTLAGIRDAINGASDNTGVSATVVNVDDGLGGTVAKLVLTSATTGTAGAVTVTVADDDGNPTDATGLSALAYDPGAGVPVTNLSLLRAAQDAKLYIDGQPVTRSSNTFDDAIAGVTLTLRGVSEEDASGDPVAAALSVDVDRAAATGLIQGFANAYNAVVDAIKQVASYNATTRQATALFGDATVRSLQASLRAELGRAVAGLPAGLASLAEVGVTTGADGKLTVSSTRLESALNSDLTAVANLFAADGGYAKRLDDLVSAYVDPDGLLKARTDGLDARVKDIDQQRDALDLRMASLQARLLKQYTAMDSLVAQLQTTGNYLTQQIESLKAQTNQ